ncbi:NUDIX hydrolase [Vagococcus silagei]|uniref:NUDIX domain-containing protein n=1 Tax=Vagococcus silagei TaxID=2508885 RepID=A0A4S3B023_9ENTE|nr:NUDIX domain-containing protein [Vagococcus silagei]THB60414.1 NUDIX domain-containing protein [Vagococcus silagei]
MPDFRTTIGDTSVDIRACGILKYHNKYYVSIEEDGTQTLTGGAIKTNETSADAVIREFREETNLRVKINKFIGTVENIFMFKEKPYHQIIFIYSVDFDGDSLINFETEEQLDYKWLAASELKDLKPKVLNDIILNEQDSISHSICKE